MRRNVAIWGLAGLLVGSLVAGVYGQSAIANLRATSTIAGGRHMLDVTQRDADGDVIEPLVVTTASAIVDAGVETEQVVALTAGQVIYVTAYDISIGGATTWRWVQGTGTNCGTGTANLTADFNGSKSHGSGVGLLFKTDAGNALCVTNGASTVKGYVSYAKF